MVVNSKLEQSLNKKLHIGYVVELEVKALCPFNSIDEYKKRESPELIDKLTIITK